MKIKAIVQFENEHGISTFHPAEGWVGGDTRYVFGWSPLDRGTAVSVTIQEVGEDEPPPDA
jgi:hypothetical protein